MTAVTSPRREGAFLTAFFCLALVLHFYFATANWHAGFLPGHEFRQSQTALVTYYIEQDHNFSPLYETPLVGKPWVSILLEFPLYEWSVVGLAKISGLPQFEAARTITLACFYLMLPAVYLLLGEAGLARPRRLLTLALILTCPVYIFYSRAFLMESMVLMFSTWFLLGFVRLMRERRLPWLLLCVITGTAAGLIKSTVFLVWLLPAAVFGAWCLWGDFRARRGWKTVLSTAAYGLAAAVVPCGATFWWIRLTDAIKAAHHSAYLFTSQNLTNGNFGLYDLAARFSWTTWRALFGAWHLAIMAPWAIGVVLFAGVVAAAGQRRNILGATVLFLAAQALFPFAYALQEYYYYACTVFLMAALGFALSGLLDSFRPRAVVWLFALLPFVAQLHNYWTGYRPYQMVQSNGGSGLTETLKAVTPPGSVIIIAGDDWSAVIPYYAQRKALMFRTGLEFDPAYIERAFNDLAGEEVGALVLSEAARSNHELVRLAAAKFDLDPTVTYSHATADVYLSNKVRENALRRLSGQSGYDQITTVAKPRVVSSGSTPVEITASLASGAFHAISPAPSQYRFKYGLSLAEVDGVPIIGAHPDSELWVPAPPGNRQITWAYGLAAAAYEREGDKTNGVDFSIAAETNLGVRREIYHRLLDPAHVPADRGLQRVVINQPLLAGETLVFITGAHGDYSYDWAYWVSIKVQ